MPSQEFQFLPRRIRRGLIEATSGAIAACFIPAFRGEFAAASLKPAYPRSRMPTPAPFRGEFAAASLKPDLLEAAPLPGPPFRGEFAAASLKQRDGDMRHRNLSRLPRRIRRGLIEAGQVGGIDVVQRPFRGEFAAASLKRGRDAGANCLAVRPSAANSPRPH